MPKRKNKKKTNPRRTALIGLTGGLGTGKSTVLEMFQKLGARIFDADKVVKKNLTKRAVVRKVSKKFGSKILSKNRIDKKKLAQIVFLSKKKKRDLESILHPMVKKEFNKFKKGNHGNVLICDIPLLFEAGWKKKFQKVIVVYSSQSVQTHRLLKKGYSRGDIKMRIKNQWPMNKKLKRADFVINNNNHEMKTLKQVKKIWNQLVPQIYI